MFRAGSSIALPAVSTATSLPLRLPNLAVAFLSRFDFVAGAADLDASAGAPRFLEPPSGGLEAFEEDCRR